MFLTGGQEDGTSNLPSPTEESGDAGILSASLSTSDRLESAAWSRITPVKRKPPGAQCRGFPLDCRAGEVKFPRSSSFLFIGLGGAQIRHTPNPHAVASQNPNSRSAAIVASRRGQRPWRNTMELVDHLLAILAGPNPGTASGELMAPGYAEYEVRGAWNYARSAGYTEWTGLGMDASHPGGRAQAAEIKIFSSIDAWRHLARVSDDCTLRFRLIQPRPLTGAIL